MSIFSWKSLVTMLYGVCAPMQIPVQDRQLQVEDEVVEDVTRCEVCSRGDREDRLLLCDGCDLGYAATKLACVSLCDFTILPSHNLCLL